ncbi:MAG: glycosyltransferase family 39 protein [Candidatus Omnitrophica bacterium]|nr:glycosyltransferase family 39 protein [Candidatus Omnitrophota bacterium]
MACRLQIDYSDSYETFLNARSFANLTDENYTFKRPLLISLLFSPVFTAEKFLPGLDPVTTCHLISVGLFGFLLGVLYRLFRLDLSRTESLCSVFLFSLCPVLIHMAPFTKEDIPGTLFIATAFYFYRRGKSKKALKNFLFAGLFIAISLDTRRTMIPMVFTFLGLYEILTLTLTKDFILKALALGLLPIGLFFLFPTIIFPMIGHAPVLGAAGKLVEEMLLSYKFFKIAYEPPITNYFFLMKTVSVPFLICALIGFAVSAYRRLPGTLFNALWFAVFFFFFTYVLSHKEARYLLVGMPPVYIFVMRGLKEIHNFFKVGIKNPIFSRVVQGLVFLLFLGIPVHRAFAEHAKFLDPVYGSYFPKEVSRYASSLAKDNHLITWCGPMYAINPKDYFFDRSDNFFYIYHFYFHVMRFYTQRKVWGLEGVEITPRAPGQKEILLGPQLGRFRRNGDVMVVNPEPMTYETRNMVQNRMPMIVQRVRTALFGPVPEDDLGGRLFESQEWPDAKIRIQKTANGFQVAGENIPDGRYELYLEVDQISYPLEFARLEVKEGRFEALRPEVKDEIPVRTLFLFYYDSVREFSV